MLVGGHLAVRGGGACGGQGGEGHSCAASRSVFKVGVVVVGPRPGGHPGLWTLTGWGGSSPLHPDHVLVSRSTWPSPGWWVAMLTVISGHCEGHSLPLLIQCYPSLLLSKGGDLLGCVCWGRTVWHSAADRMCTEKAVVHLRLCEAASAVWHGARLCLQWSALLRYTSGLH